MNCFRLKRNRNKTKGACLFSLLISILVLLTGAFYIQGCTGSQMSLEEAKSVSLSTSKKTMEPPPRRIDDIINVLNHYTESDESKTNEYRKILASDPPKNGSDYDFAMYYLKKARVASYAGDFNSSLKFIRSAYDYDQKDGNIDIEILFQTAYFEEFMAGNYKTSVELWSKVLDITNSLHMWREAVQMYLRAGDIRSAKRAAKEAEKKYKLNEELSFTNMVSINAMMLDAYGKNDLAEKEWIKAIDGLDKYRKKVFISIT